MDLQQAIATQRRALAADLETLDDARWRSASLCAGWTVAHVVAHLTMPFRYSAPAVVLRLLAARGNFDRVADTLARRDVATLSPADLTRCVRDNATTAWKPPGGGYLGALTHEIVHGLDIRRPLHLEHDIPAEVIVPVLDVLAPRAASFGTDLAGIQLRADDLEWTLGTGDQLTAHSQDLILILCGRSLDAVRMAGPGARRLRHPAAAGG
jgi:uncharacterized protein (TIGR03083 family)